MDNGAPPRRHRLLNESLSARYGISPYELLVREAPEAFQTAWAVVIVLGFPT